MTINSKKRGRPNSEKIWSNKISHVFSTDITRDPDLHVMLYMHGDQATNVIRQALRDYMVAANSKAMDPDFRERLFMAANQLLVRGENSGPSNVLPQIGEDSRSHTAPIKEPEPSSSKKHQAEAPQQATPVEEPDDRPRKPAPIIDFGPDTIDDTTNTSSTPKQSQRDKWLGRHK